MKLLSIKATSNRTTRFTLLGKQGFYRIRKIKRRWGFGNTIGKPTTFKQVHLGRLTIALQFKGGRNLFGFATNATK